MRRALWISAAVCAALATVGGLAARAEGGKGEAVVYKDGAVELEGYLVGPASGTAEAGVIVVPEWWGLGDYERHRADQLAALGYAAFAVDMYGKGVKTDDPAKAKELSGAFYKDRSLFRSRAAAGLAQLKNSKFKPKVLAAIGYCFGGTTVLELARSGADVKGVVSFHGALANPKPEDAKNIKGKVLVCHGGDDGFVSEKDVSDFEAEMRNAGVDWQLNTYGGAVHAFSNPAADKHGIKGIAYNEKADKRSWLAMESFFHEIFGK